MNQNDENASRPSAHFYRGVAIAQFIAPLSASGGTMLEILGDDSLPFFTASCTYALLVITHASYLFIKQKGTLHNTWWKYGLIAQLDTQAAYFSILALRYTSVTSWTLIMPSGMLTVVPLSILLLKARYTWKHAISGFLAFLGLIILLLSDVSGSDGSSRTRWEIVGGDLSAFFGTSLYGMNSVLVEWAVKNGAPSYEAMGMIGMFGCPLSALWAWVLGEYSPSMFRTSSIAAMTFAVAVINFGFYALAVFVLRDAGAAVLDVSLLASNFWSVLGKLLIIGGFNTNVTGFIFSIVLIITGVTLFTLSGNPYAKTALSYAPVETELPSVDGDSNL